jgi:hypothetical protein
MDWSTFWTAVGAIGTLVAAAAAVWVIVRPPLPPPPPPKNGSTQPGPRGPTAVPHQEVSVTDSIQLQGRWTGDLGDEWDFQAEVHVEKGKAGGSIHWRLVECPPSLPWASYIGENGTEVVEGTLEVGVLKLSGKEVIARYPDLLGLSDYTLPLPISGQSFEGKSRPQKRGKYQEAGVLRGTVYVTRKPSPHSD